MTKREIIYNTLEFREIPYVPWHFRFTFEAKEKLLNYLKGDDLDEYLQNHIIGLGNDIGFFEELGNNLYKDAFGVVWDRSVDKDIGIARGTLLPKPSLNDYLFPDPLDKRFYEDIPGLIDKYGDRFRLYSIGFSLFERAWTMRGMENLFTDFYLNPRFVHELLDTITEYNIAQIKEASMYDIDGFLLGDDWGRQTGLLMGYDCWKEFIYPQLKRTYKEVKDRGKYVFIHSCGKVDELFGDLTEIGVDCFNPFQPEVMDTKLLLKQYRNKLSFWGGLSIQKLLPFGSAEEVRRESRNLLDLGKGGGFIFSPSHSVEGDTPVENIIAFIEEAKKQLVC
jgi:uroporphyrinogen decarboxylase